MVTFFKARVEKNQNFIHSYILVSYVRARALRTPIFLGLLFCGDTCEHAKPNHSQNQTHLIPYAGYTEVLGVRSYGQYGGTYVTSKNQTILILCRATWSAGSGMLWCYAVRHKPNQTIVPNQTILILCRATWSAGSGMLWCYVVRHKPNQTLWLCGTGKSHPANNSSWEKNKKWRHCLTSNAAL